MEETRRLIFAGASFEMNERRWSYLGNHSIPEVPDDDILILEGEAERSFFGILRSGLENEILAERVSLVDCPVHSNRNPNVTGKLEQGPADAAVIVSCQVLQTSRHGSLTRLDWNSDEAGSRTSSD